MRATILWIGITSGDQRVLSILDGDALHVVIAAGRDVGFHFYWHPMIDFSCFLLCPL